MFKKEAKAMLIYLTSPVLILLIVILFWPRISPKKHVSDTYVSREVRERSFSTFISSIRKFPYDASAKKKERIVSNYDKLSIGISRNDALSLLGEPDSITEEYNKTKGNLFLGWTWTYYLYRHEAELSNDMYDQIVTLYFDKLGKMYRALPMNIKTPAEKGTTVSVNQ